MKETSEENSSAFMLHPTVKCYVNLNQILRINLKSMYSRPLKQSVTSVILLFILLFTF